MKTTVSVMKSVWVDVDIEVELDDIDPDAMAEHLRLAGHPVPDYENQLWHALRAGDANQVKRLLADMIYERIGKII